MILQPLSSSRPAPSWLRRLGGLCITLLLFTGQPGLFAQEPTPGRISVRVEMVNILCSVIDKKGAFVNTLGKDDFILYENNVPQTIENFSSKGDLPLTIALLIDTSASVAPKLAFEQDAASEFFTTLLRPKDKALLSEFDSGVTLIQDYTNDANLLTRQLHTLKAAGGTSLFDALYLLSEEKILWDTGDKRKTIVIISDGEDTVSRTTYEEARDMVQRAGATVYAISTNRTGSIAVGTGEGDRGDKVLEDLANATGGKVFYPAKLDDLGLAFREIDRELRSQYSMSYRSTNPKRDGTYRTIRITVRGKGLQARHRKGYYAAKETVAP